MDAEHSDNPSLENVDIGELLDEMTRLKNDNERLHRMIKGLQTRLKWAELHVGGCHRRLKRVFHG